MFKGYDQVKPPVASLSQTLNIKGQFRSDLQSSVESPSVVSNLVQVKCQVFKLQIQHKFLVLEGQAQA